MSNSIVNADLVGSIAYSKLSLTGAILNADLAGSIADSKLSQITTASKVSGTSITSLASLPAGAGIIPFANLPSQIISLISTTPVSAATTSGAITIVSTNNYMVVLNGRDSSAGTNTLGILINGDTGNNYQSGYSGRGATAAIGASNSSAASIVPSTTLVASKAFNATFYIMQDAVTSTNINIYGILMGQLTTGGIGTISNFGGTWVGAATPISFAFTGSGNWTGTVYLYQIKTS